MCTKSFQDGFVALSEQPIPFIPQGLDAWSCKIEQTANHLISIHFL